MNEYIEQLFADISADPQIEVLKSRVSKKADGTREYRMTCRVGKKTHEIMGRGQRFNDAAWLAVRELRLRAGLSPEETPSPPDLPY
jgi:hypothetical protein